MSADPFVQRLTIAAAACGVQENRFGGQVGHLLGEATSALDAGNEARMYSLLRDLDDVAYVSVGHRGSLLGFHEQVLRLEGDSSWRVVSAEAYGKELGRNGAARLEEA